MNKTGSNFSSKKKLVAIGDIHGLTVWKDIVERNKDADKIIFVGDYFDSFQILPEKQLKNFNDIVSFAQTKPDQVVLLMGNHDYHYYGSPAEKYPGYNSEHALAFRCAISNAWDSLHYLYVQDGIIFSHAGFTKTYLKKIKWVSGFDDNGKLLDTYLKQHTSELKFDPIDRYNYGESVYHSCIWVRPNELIEDAVDGFDQVVGHTPERMISKHATLCGHTITFIDCLDNRTKRYWTNIGEEIIEFKNHDTE